MARAPVLAADSGGPLKRFWTAPIENKRSIADPQDCRSAFALPQVAPEAREHLARQ